MKRIVEIADTEKEARRMREVFMARPAKSSHTFSWGWPPTLRHVGKCLAVMYTSDKWKDVGDFEDYKHIAEAPQDLLLVDSYGFKNGRANVGLHGQSVELVAPMPSHMATLAPLLGLQAQLFDKSGKLGKGGDRLLELDIARATLGGAYHPTSKEPFLCIYQANGLIAIITGKELDVEKDGIVG
jgi:hypothetical protein